MKKEIEYIRSKGFPYIKLELEACWVSWRGLPYNALEEVEEHYQNLLEKAEIPTRYLQVYHDSTVDLEATVTFPIQVIPRLPEAITLFIQACGLVGGDISYRNAGLHITLLPTSKYPTDDTLPDTEITNFVEAMNELIPILFLFSGYGNGTTRPYNYRKPYIAQNNKYHAIFTGDDTCLEYRIFDPCYDNPKRVLHFIKIIARTLKFYSKRRYSFPLRNDIQLKQLRHLSRCYPNNTKEDIEEAIYGLFGKNKKITNCLKTKRNYLRELAKVCL